MLRVFRHISTRATGFRALPTLTLRSSFSSASLAVLDCPSGSRSCCGERRFFVTSCGRSMNTSNNLDDKSSMENRDEQANLEDSHKQTAKYFEQYIEEYYEQEDEEVQNTSELKKVKAEESEVVMKSCISQITVENVASLLEEHRAQQIQVFEVPPEKGPSPYVVVCSPYNHRHGEALIQIVRKHIKTLYFYEEFEMPRHARVTNGWFIFDMRNVILHVMSEEARAKYDLESLYSPESLEAEPGCDDDMIPPSATRRGTAAEPVDSTPSQP